MEKIIIANWKMNPSNQKDALHLFDAVKKGVKKIKNVDIIICPPFVYLSLLKGLTLGAQNIFWEEKGAFTGQISTLMLKDFNVEYVIVGHSERRKHFGETDEMINKKIKKSLAVGLKVILCIGENEGEDKSSVLEIQLKEGLNGVLENDLGNIVMAYEPIWAIGTGKNCSIEETKKSVEIIKNIISKLYSETTVSKIKILYGGSVNSTNSKDYLEQADVGGLLVGGASLNPEEFVKIVASAGE